MSDKPEDIPTDEKTLTVIVELLEYARGQVSHLRARSPTFEEELADLTERARDLLDAEQSARTLQPTKKSPDARQPS